MLLLFQALRDADPAFSIGLAFSHDFPRYVFCRTAHAPSPGKNNPVVEPTRQPIILLYPHWTSSNTVVALTDSGNNHGLKLADYKFLGLRSRKHYASIASCPNCRFDIFSRKRSLDRWSRKLRNNGTLIVPHAWHRPMTFLVVEAVPALGNRVIILFCMMTCTIFKTPS